MENKDTTASPAVSVIVAVYNVEKYIRQCVDSFLSQTFTDFELILVDDGSPDRCGEICDEYAARDSRVRVIYQLNGGVSVARQSGLDAATGEYVIHADPDDWVDAGMLEEMVGEARRTAADMVVCDYWTERASVSYYSKAVDSPDGRIEPADFLKKILFQQLHGSCWNKLLRRTCYSGIGFYPSHLNLCEDELFNIRVLNSGRVKRIAYLPKGYYHYRINVHSICSTPTPKHLQSKMTVIEEVGKMVDIAEYDNLTAMKIEAFFWAFLLKMFDALPTLYPEINDLIVQGGRHFNPLAPRMGCMSLALRGYPRFAYRLYNLSMRLVHAKERLQSLLGEKYNKR